MTPDGRPGRPRVQLTDAQLRLLARITQQAARNAEADRRLDQLMTEARASGVPMERIAEAATVTVRTVYNRLARSADGDHGGPESHSAP